MHNSENALRNDVKAHSGVLALKMEDILVFGTKANLRSTMAGMGLGILPLDKEISSFKSDEQVILYQLGTRVSDVVDAIVTLSETQKASKKNEAVKSKKYLAAEHLLRSVNSGEDEAHSKLIAIKRLVADISDTVESMEDTVSDIDEEAAEEPEGA